ncbi:MAG: tetratricopeptide repeat protein [Betaproteobacteria bacterium]|nr:MAG: tetratricopeptide repeat protein [Betaproteobacteria bacterium]
MFESKPNPTTAPFWALKRVVLGLALLGFTQLTSAQPAELQDANRLLKAGQAQQALDRANGFLNAKPKDAVGRFIKGLAQSELGRTNDAIATFQSLTEDFPELPEPYNNLAVLYSSKGQFEKARVALELAIQTHPSYATAHENLGDIYAKLASQAYDKALQLDKSNNAAATKLNLVKDLFSTSPRALTAPRANVATATTPVTAVASAATKASTPPAATPPAAPAPTAKSAASTPAAAAATAPAPAPATTTIPAADPKQDVLAAVTRWARAWSSRNADGYLAAYSKSFDPEGSQSRAAWAAARRERVTTPKRINVEVIEPSVQIVSSNEVRVVFRQNYASDTLNAKSRKTLVLVREDGEWKISRERSG